MTRHRVRRYIGHGTPSVADRRDQPTPQTRLIGWIARTFLPRAYQELTQMSRLVTESGLDWTIVRFTAPKNGPAKGKHQAGFYGTTKIGFSITRTDIAVFTTAMLTDSTYIDAAPAISN